MIIDTLMEFSAKQAVTAEAKSENVVNLNTDTSPNATTNQGVGEPVWLSVYSLDNTATGKLTIALETSDKESMAGKKELQRVGPFELKGAGRVVAFRLPSVTYERYIGLRYIPEGAANLTVSAFVTADIDENIAYATSAKVI